MKETILFLISFIVGVSIVVEITTIASYSQRQNHVINPLQTTPSSFSFEKAPSQSINGIIQSFSGDTEWQSRTATQPAAFTAPKTIQQGESIVTKNKGKAQIVFAQTASMSAEANTTINIIQTLPTAFVLEQTSGTARYFKVGNIPVTIRTGDLITNLDGQATISFDDKQQDIIITTQQGTVTEAYNDSQDNSTLVTVKQAEQFVFDETEKQGTIE